MLSYRLGVSREHVMRHGGAKLSQPPGGHLGEHRALMGNGFAHDDVERAYAVRRDQQQPIGVDFVHVAHLPATEQRQRKRAVATCRRALRSRIVSHRVSLARRHRAPSVTAQTCTSAAFSARSP